MIHSLQYTYLIIQVPFMYLAFIKNPSTLEGKFANAPQLNEINDDTACIGSFGKKGKRSSLYDKMFDGNSIAFTREITNNIY